MTEDRTRRLAMTEDRTRRLAMTEDRTRRLAMTEDRTRRLAMTEGHTAARHDRKPHAAARHDIPEALFSTAYDAGWASYRSRPYWDQRRVTRSWISGVMVMGRGQPRV
jgi:hypothetical protein